MNINYDLPNPIVDKKEAHSLEKSEPVDAILTT